MNLLESSLGFFFLEETNVSFSSPFAVEILNWTMRFLGLIQTWLAKQFPGNLFRFWGWGFFHFAAKKN